MSGFAFEFNLTETLGISIAVLLLGKLLVSKVSILERFCIPAPVVGGLVFALLNLVGYATGTFSVSMDMTLKNFFMICFFTTVGFGASMSILKKGGLGVAIFFAVSSLLCVIQNAVGAGIAVAFGENPLLGLATGSIPMTGGHGTSAAFGPLLEQAGLSGGLTIAVAAATFGLISGSLLGGPTARRLIERKRLKAQKQAVAAGSHASQTQLRVEDVVDEREIPLNTGHLSTGFFQIAIAVGIGSVISGLIAKTGIVLPAYVGSMLVAAAMRNIMKDGSRASIRLKEIQALGDIFLSVFLAQALMDLRLWELADLALPMSTILIVQVVIMFLFATFVTFPFMGRDYDAAVIASGHCGFGLGATPNGVANMTAVTQRYGPSTKAFFILPIVGGLFIDVSNSFIITLFLNFLK